MKLDNYSGFISGSTKDDVEQLEQFGTTSLAYKIKLNGQVCFMKRLRPELRNDQRVRELFYKEYNTGKKIDCPHVVKYLDIKDDADGLCIIMEYVNGRTLKEKIEKEPQYFNQSGNIKRLLLQLCKALEALHGGNIVHLDINPGNIIISQTSNEVKLVDLGFCISDWSDTTAGTTARFGAPEATANDIEEIDARSDIYSVGRILQYIAKRSGATLPRYIRRIMHRCLREQKSQRYSSVTEIIREAKCHRFKMFGKVAAAVLAAALCTATFACDLYNTIADHIAWERGDVPARFETNGIFYHITDRNARTVEVTYKGEHPDEYEYEYTGDKVNTPKTVTYRGRTFSVTAIASEAFKNPYISKIDIPDGIVTIEKEAFKHCSLDGVINIPGSVKFIGDAAFYPTQYIDGFVVDSTNTVYDSREECNAIIETATNTLLYGGKWTIIPNSVTSIAEKSFAGVAMDTITIPQSVASIGKAAFTHSGLTEIHLPGNITVLDEYLFQWSEKLRTITFPKSLREIRLAALSHCGFTELTIPDSVTTIGDYAFDYNEQLEKVIIGCSVAHIGDYAFDGCNSLTCVVSLIPAEKLFRIDSNVFGNIGKDCILYVPKGARSTYEKTQGWNIFAKIVELQ